MQNSIGVKIHIQVVGQSVKRRERDSNPCTLSRSCFRDSRLTAWLPRHLILESSIIKQIGLKLYF